MKFNNTFNHEDEWFLLYGPPITAEEALSISKIQWKIIKGTIQKEKDKMNQYEENGVFWKEHRFKYTGLLWKYQEIIKLNKIKGKENEEEKQFSFKKPKI